MLRSVPRLALIAVILPLFAAVAAPARGQVPPYLPAARFYGTVTVNGLPPAVFTTVTAASLSGATCGTGYVSDSSGSYSVDVQGYDGCAGRLVFLVNGQQADQSSALPNLLSGAVQLNLTVTALPPPPPPPPAPLPVPYPLSPYPYPYPGPPPPPPYWG